MRWRWLLWLIPLYLIAFIAYAPASLVAWGVSKFGGVNAPKLLNMSGSLWQGHIGTLQVVTPFGTRLELQQIDFKVNGWALLTGRLEAEVQIAALPSNLLDGHFALSAHRGGLDALQGVLNGDAGRAVRELNLPSALPIQGLFSLQLDTFSYTDFSQRRACDTLQGRLDLRAVQLQLSSQWASFGDYSTRLNCGAHGELLGQMDGDNVLGLNFVGSVDVSQRPPRISASGHLQPTLEAPTAVTELLPYWGQADAQGRYHFSW